MESARQGAGLRVVPTEVVTQVLLTRGATCVSPQQAGPVRTEWDGSREPGAGVGHHLPRVHPVLSDRDAARQRGAVLLAEHSAPATAHSQYGDWEGNRSRAIRPPTGSESEEGRRPQVNRSCHHRLEGRGPYLAKQVVGGARRCVSVSVTPQTPMADRAARQSLGPQFGGGSGHLPGGRRAAVERAAPALAHLIVVER